MGSAFDVTGGVTACPVTAALTAIGLFRTQSQEERRNVNTSATIFHRRRFGYTHMTDSKSDSPDIFVANKIFPDAKGIFFQRYESLTEIRESCTVIVDTNALLVPYGVSKSGLTEIESTYKSLAKSNRLVIPGQVAREFARSRPLKIAEIFQALSRKQSSVATLQKGRYPLLEDVSSYAKLQELENQIDTLIREYRSSIKDLLEYIRGWNWDDPVSKIYGDIFPDAVVDPELDHAEIQNHLKYQRVNKLPPGYKDASKEDQGIGDQLIWQVVVQVAKERQKPIVFVSGDTKADWFYRSENQALFPRFELVDEVRRVSGGKSLHIIPFSSFLELFGATAEAVGEVRNEEIKVDLASMSRYGRAAVTGHFAEVAVTKWLQQKHPYLEVEREERSGDYIWSDPAGATVLISIKYFEGMVELRRVQTHLINQMRRFDRLYDRGDKRFDNILIFLVFDSESFADDSMIQRLLSLLNRREQQQTQMVFAEFSDGELVRVEDPQNFLPDFG